MKRKSMIQKAKKVKKASVFTLIAREVFYGRMMRVDSRDGNSYYVSPVPGGLCEIGKLFCLQSIRVKRDIHTLPLDLYHLWKYGPEWM